jgi:hypothetical protein
VGRIARSTVWQTRAPSASAPTRNAGPTWVGRCVGPTTTPVPPNNSADPPTVQLRPAVPAQKRGVRLTIEPAELTVASGSEVTTTVAVRNLGTRVEEFRLMPRGPATPLPPSR